jgi:hypothetical protein
MSRLQLVFMVVIVCKHHTLNLLLVLVAFVGMYNKNRI